MLLQQLGQALPVPLRFDLLLLFVPADEGQLVFVAKGVRAGRQELTLLHVLGAAPGGGGHLEGFVEEGVVYPVLALLLEDDGLEAVAPQDLGGQVGASRLRGHGRGLHQPLQYDHDLKVGRFQVLLADAEQRAFLVDFVHHGEGGHQEEAVGAFVVAHVHVDLIQGDVFPFLRVTGLEELRPHVSFHDVALPQIGDPEHKTELPVVQGDDRVVAEQEGLGALFGPRHLGHDGADHEGVDDAAHDGLKDHHEDRGRALLRDAAGAVPDGRLRLHGKQEGRHEGVDLRDARNEPVVHPGAVHVAVE